MSVVCVLGMRNALEVYRHPCEVRTSFCSLEPQKARRTAIMMLVAFPVVWLLIALSTLGFI